jgi:hypothetical protein
LVYLSEREDLNYEETDFLGKMTESRINAVNELTKTIKDDISKHSINVDDFISSLSAYDNTKELKELEERINEYSKKMDAIVNEKGNIKGYMDPEYQKVANTRLEAIAEKNKVKEKSEIINSEKVSQYLRGKFGTDFNISVEKTTLPEITKKLQDTLKGCVAKEWEPSKGLRVEKARGRASCGAISIKGNNTISTMIHEYAHFLEDNNPEMLANSLAFAKYRTEGEKAARLKTITNLSYSSDEKARPDKFFDPYCGKVYAFGKNADYSTAYASEIMSMGMERLFTDPVNFAKDDKEYFNFVIANMRGLL